MVNSAGSGKSGFVPAADHCDAFWFLNTLTLNKITGEDTVGGFTIVDHRVPGGFAPPHIHHQADEAFFIIDGEFEGFCGEQSWAAGPGSIVFLPRELPHGFSVSEAGPGRTLLILAPAGFDAFVAQLGEPAPDLRIPDPSPPDIARVIEVAAAHGLTILPPP